MKLEFVGADHEVTGSCHYVECGKTKLLVDYGLEQGINYFKNVPLPVSPEELDYVIITHAHIDHTGKLPLLFKEGFKGTVICTDATGDLLAIMLKDSANLAVQDAEHKNRHLRKGMKRVEPLFDFEDVEKALSSVYSIKYQQLYELSDNVSLRFADAGHLLGSASIEMFLTEGDIKKKLVFSGDIGNTNKPIIRDPQYIREADFVVTEATYADSLHALSGDFVDILASVLKHTFDKGGNVVIPAFAVGRTQEILYYMTLIKSAGLVKGHDHFEVWVDSPMAVNATEVFKDNLIDCYDEPTKALVEKGINPIAFDDLCLAVTREESIRLNSLDYPKVIISSSGMCDAGRILHHLKHNLARPESTMVFAGYQAVGTLGRKILEGADEVRIGDDVIPVNAEVCTLTNMSSHADRDGLLKWISAFDRSMLKKTFVVHSDDKVAIGYCELLKSQLGIDAEAPFSGAVYDLADELWVRQPEGVPLQHTKQQLDDYDVYIREVR